MTTYTLIRSRRRTLSIQINPEKGLVVRAPIVYPKFLIERFIKSKESWIEKHLTRIKKQKSSLHAKTPHFLGEPISLPFNTGSPSDNHKNVRWYKKEALKYLTARTLELAKELSAIRGENLKPKQVKIRSYRSRWGTCSRDNTITYNWRVIMAKPEAITYLVAHELSHIVHKNHSHRFYSVLEKLDPDYKTHRKLLRTLSTS